MMTWFLRRPSPAGGRAADLSRADLTGADLSVATLHEANLVGAMLSNANLKWAKGVINKELERQAPVADAIMPNGQKHEDWLKDREKRQQDE